MKRETVRYPAASAEGTPRPEVEQQTTGTTTETTKESSGVTRTGVNFIDEVIAIPFRLIGAAFSALF